MKFDRIVMNPPYVRNLHLKILAEAIKHLKDEKSVCVNLSPVRWLQDPLAKYKKNCDLKRFEESVARHIESLEIVSMADANKLFGDKDDARTKMTMELGIYRCATTLTNFDYKVENSIIDKVMAKLKTSFADVIESRKLDGWRVRVNEMQPLETLEETVSVNKWRYHIINPNTETYVYKDGYTEHSRKFWTELITKNAYVKDGDALPHSIKFGTKEEAYNFEAFCKTTFMDSLKVMGQRDVHVPLFIFPFLGDAINPRTGKKGYTGEWTDDDLALYFGITPEEKEEIEMAMEKYKCS